MHLTCCESALVLQGAEGDDGQRLGSGVGSRLSDRDAKGTAMRTAPLLAVVATALALVGGASAATPHGHLSGSASLTSSNIFAISITSTVSDGETVNVALRNDKSGDCDGDTCTLDVGVGTFTHISPSIVCAHYTGRGMAFDFLDNDAFQRYVVVFIVDGSPDKIFIGTTNGTTAADATLAMKWVNLGWQGSGAKAAGLAFPQAAITAGDYTVTA
jgi:hypothetical protein